MAHRKITKICIDCDTEKPRTSFEYGTKGETRKFCATCRDARNVKRYKACTKGRLRYLKGVRHTSEHSYLACKTCLKIKPLKLFSHAVYKGQRHYYRRCKECYNRSQREMRVRTGYTKVPNALRRPRFDSNGVAVKRCPVCQEVKPLNQMSQSLRFICKTCGAVRHTNTRNTRRARQCGNAVEHVDRQRVIKRDGLHCYLCDKAIKNPKQVTLDHVIPIAKGGPHSESNLRVAHRSCNSRKRTRLTKDLTWIRHPLFTV